MEDFDALGEEIDRALARGLQELKNQGMGQDCRTPKEN